jgi:DNA-binding CsgD family transcriptional regulator
MKKIKTYEELQKENEALKQENEALHKENSQLKAESPLTEYAMRKLPGMVMICGVAATCSDESLSRNYSNPAQHRCLGYSAAEFEALGSDCFRKMMMADDFHCLTDLAAFFKTHPAKPYLTMCRMTNKEGEIMLLLIAACRLSGHADGSTSKFIILGIPLTFDLHKADLLEAWLKEYKRSQHKAVISQLTKCQLVVIKLFVEGYNTKEAADKLFRSQRTVQKHRDNNYKIMKVHDRISIIRKARLYGID